MMPVIASTNPIRWPAQQSLSIHSEVSQIELTADASRLVIRTADGALSVWDPINSYSIVASIGRNDGHFVTHFALSHDGTRLAIATKSHKIHLWDSKNGVNRGPPIDVSRFSIGQLAFSPTQPHIISGLGRLDNLIQIWNMDSGEPIEPQMRLSGSFLSFTISPDGSRLVSMSGFGNRREVILWDLHSIAALITFQSLLEYNSGVVFNANGSRFLIWDGRETISLRQSDTGSLVAELTAPNQSLSKALFSPNSDYISAFSRSSPAVFLWNQREGNHPTLLKGHRDDLIFLSFSSDGERLASVSLDQTVRVWEVSTGARLQSFFTGYTGSIGDCILSSNWGVFATVTIDHQINLYDLSLPVKGQDVAEPLDTDLLRAPLVAFSRSSKICLQGNPKLQLWDLETATRIGGEWHGHIALPTALAFSPDDRLVVSGSSAGPVQVWDVKEQSLIGQPMEGHHHHVKRVVFSPDSRYIASISRDSIQAWDTQSAANVWSHQTPSRGDQVRDVAFGPDGMELAACSYREMNVWGLNGGKKTASADWAYAMALAFSPKGNYIATAHTMCLVLWAIGEEEIIPVAELPLGHAHEYHKLKSLKDPRIGISSDGMYLAQGFTVFNISSLPVRLLSDGERPPSLSEPGSFPHSLLSYADGWIHSSYPKRRVMPIPDYLQGRFKNWGATGNKVVGWTWSRTPIVIDCSPLLSDSGAQC
jgi:WD40 repeat protein